MARELARHGDFACITDDVEHQPAGYRAGAAASTQLIGALRAKFLGVKILISELTDPEFGLSFAGPMPPGPGQRRGRLRPRPGSGSVAPDLDRVAEVTREVGAVWIDTADWARRLFGDDPDPDQLARLTDLVWDLVEEILDRGGAVLLDADPVWVQRVATAGHPVRHHRP